MHHTWTVNRTSLEIGNQTMSEIRVLASLFARIARLGKKLRHEGMGA